MQSQPHDVMLYEAWTWLEKNKKQVTMALCAVAAAGLAIWFFVTSSRQKQIAASEAVSKLVVGQALDQQPGTTPPENADAYLKAASAYAGSPAGARALLIGAAALFSEGKYTEAQTQFEKFTRQHSSDQLMPQALLGIAASLDAQNKASEAITAYKNIVDRHAAQPVAAQAKVALARLYEAQNKPELALPLLEELGKTDPYGSIGAEAGMRAEEIKLKHPELVPPAVVPSNTAPTIAISTNVTPTPAAVGTSPTPAQNK